MTDMLPWFATAATILAATVTASNLGTRITGWGFGIFLLGSLAWLAHGIAGGDQALAWTNGALTLLNIFGMWRWLGRQAQVEEGGRAAAETSARLASETLFPVSQLTRLEVRGGRGSIGHCVDAMAGSQSGRIRYLVLSDGGIAGVGETLRRIDWDRVEAKGDVLMVHVADAAALPALDKDHWPGR